MSVTPDPGLVGAMEGGGGALNSPGFSSLGETFHAVHSVHCSLLNCCYTMLLHSCGRLGKP